MTYAILPHTADIKATLSSRDLKGLHQSAVDLIREVLVGASDVAETEVRTVPLEGPEPGEQFYRFVRELLYLYDVERFIPARVTAMDPPTVSGEILDPRRHVYEHQVKAVTRHQYAFRRRAEGYRVEILFDL